MLMPTRLPHEGETALSPFAVDVRERSFIQEHAARRDLQPALGMRRIGTGIAFDDDLGVLEQHVPARRRRREPLHRAPRKLHAVSLRDLRDLHRLRMDEAFDILQAFGGERIGIHLEGRKRDDADVPIVRRSRALLPGALPDDLIEGSAARLRPERRARHDPIEADAPLDRL